MSRWRIAVLVALALPLLLLGLAALGWALDTRDDAGQARRGVSLAGTDMAGMDRKEVGATVAELADTLPATKVTIEADGTRFNTTAADLGVGVDTAATTAAVMAEGHDDPGILAPIRWAGSLFSDRHVDVSLSVDPTAAAAAARFAREGASSESTCSRM